MESAIKDHSCGIWAAFGVGLASSSGKDEKLAFFGIGDNKVTSYLKGQRLQHSGIKNNPRNQNVVGSNPNRIK